MPEFKLTINDPKTGRSFKKLVSGAEADIFKSMKIGEKVKGDQIGMKGYELEIRGGSDNAGFPMRYDIQGIARKKPYLSKGPGVRIKRKGMRTRKTICGNTLHTSISQINLKITSHGTDKIEKIFGVEEKEEIKEKKKTKEPIEQKKESKKDSKTEIKKEIKEPEKIEATT